MKKNQGTSEIIGKIGTNTLIVGILFLAIFLRVYRIGAEDFWVDEIGHIQAASEMNILAVLDQVRIHKGAAPLDYWILHVYYQILNPSGEALYRLPYAFYGTLAVISTFLLGRRIYGQGVGLLSAFLLSISPFHIRYSQEVRFYSLSILLSLISFLCLERAVHKRTTKAWIVWGAVNLFAIYTFYYFVFLLFFQLVYVCWLFYDKAGSRKLASSIDNEDLRTAIIVSVMTILLFVPWAIWDFSYSDIHLVSTNQLSLGSIITDVGGEIGGIFALLLIFLFPILYIISDKHSRIFLLIFVGSLMGAFAVDSLFGYFFSPRQIIFTLPFLFIAVSSSIQQLVIKVSIISRRPIKHFALISIAGFLVVVFLMPIYLRLPAYYTNRQKPAWSLVAEYLMTEFGFNDLVVFTHMERKSLQYYISRLDPGLLPNIYLSENYANYKQILVRGDTIAIHSELWVDYYPEDFYPFFEDMKTSSILLDNIYIILPKQIE